MAACGCFLWRRVSDPFLAQTTLRSTPFVAWSAWQLAAQLWYDGHESMKELNVGQDLL